MNKLFVVFFAFILSFQSFSQNVEFDKSNFDDKKQLKEILKEIEEGNKFYEMGTSFYVMALPFYLKAQRFNSNNAQLNYKIGNCYLYSEEKFRSLDFYVRAEKLNPNLNNDLNLKLGRAYHLNMKFDEAVTYYKKFIAAANPKKEAEEIKKAEKHIKECGFGKQYVAEPKRVFIDNVGQAINSKYPEYGPLITADQSLMLFTSRREGSTGGKKDELINQYFEDIYFSEKINGEWTKAQNIGKPINSSEHDATIGLSPDGQKLLIYQDDGGDGNIYECELKGELWSKPEKLNKNINTKHHESSASYSPDGKALYFVSNREDMTLGGRDIFVSYLDEKGKWGKPTNLGNTINTEYNEESVFMHPDGKTMFFSSQGHSSMGGYDIFKTKLENGVWSKPENIGYPINTPDDDVFFVLGANGRQGYYSSFRQEGFGEKDIYKITFLGPEKPMILTQEDNLLASKLAPIREKVVEPKVEVTTVATSILKGKVIDMTTKQPVYADIELIENTENKVLAVFKSNSKTGNYLVSLPSGRNYGIAVKADNYLFHSENFIIPEGADYQEFIKNIELKSVAVGSKIVLKNIFFDTGKFDLRSESTSELERLTKMLNDIPTLKIEISGHTDNRGSATMNKTLSENRAKAVVDYLIKNGINKDRLVYKGYGLERPIETNDTEDGRQQNRRTEFEVLSK